MSIVCRYQGLQFQFQGLSLHFRGLYQPAEHLGSCLKGLAYTPAMVCLLSRDIFVSHYHSLLPLFGPVRVHRVLCHGQTVLSLSARTSLTVSGRQSTAVVRVAG